MLGLLLRAFSLVSGLDRRCVRVGKLLAAFTIERGADADVDREALAGVTFIYAAHGSDVAVVAAVRDRHVPVAGDEVVDRIEVHPADAR